MSNANDRSARTGPVEGGTGLGVARSAVQQSADSPEEFPMAAAVAGDDRRCCSCQRPDLEQHRRRHRCDEPPAQAANAAAALAAKPRWIMLEEIQRSEEEADAPDGTPGHRTARRAGEPSSTRQTCDNGEEGDRGRVARVQWLRGDPDGELGHGLEVVRPNGGGQKAEGQWLLVVSQIREIVEKEASVNEGHELHESAQNPDDACRGAAIQRPDKMSGVRLHLRSPRARPLASDARRPCEFLGACLRQVLVLRFDRRSVDLR